MMRHACLIISAFAAFMTEAHGQTLKNLSIAGTAATFNPGGSAVSTWSIEGRIDGITASKNIISSPSQLVISTDGSTNLTMLQGGDGTGSGTPTFSETPGNDVRFRAQRDGTNSFYQLETWDGACTNHQFRQIPVTVGAALTMNTTFSVGPNIVSGFIRGYSMMDATQACPQDAPTTVADLFDFTWENGSGGTLVSRNTSPITASAAGSSFTDSTHSYNPYSCIGGFFPARRVPGGFRAGIANGFSSCAVSFQYPGDNSNAAFLWSNTACTAGTLNYSSTTSASPTLTASTAADCPVSLKITDSQGNTTATTHIGFVNADSQGRVTYGTTEQSQVIGPVLAYGFSPQVGGTGFPLWESTWSANVDQQAAVQIAGPTETAGTGTCSIPSGVPNQISASRITALTYGAVAGDCPSVSFDSSWIGRYLDVHWDVDGDASFAGHMVVLINAVDGANPHRFITNNFSLSEPVASISTSLNWGWMTNGAFEPRWNGGTLTFDQNFYAAGGGVVRLYLATGLDTYRSQASQFCNNWYRYAIDSGFSSRYVPRSVAVTSLFLCAEMPGFSAPPNYWPNLANHITLVPGNWYDCMSTPISEYNPTAVPCTYIWDVREQSYTTEATAILARYGGNHGVTAATWRGYLTNQINNIWLANAITPSNNPGGVYRAWGENLTALNGTYLYSAHPPVTGQYGGSAWRGLGFPLRTLIYAFQCFADASACNNATIANNLYKGDLTGLIERVARLVQDYSIDQIGGTFFDVNYEAAANGSDISDGTPRSGTINNGQAVISASGTGLDFTVNVGANVCANPYGCGGVGPCDGTTYISFRTGDIYTQAAYKVTACTTTTVTISPAWQGGTVTSVAMSAGARDLAGAACGPLAPQAAYCSPDLFNGRSLDQYVPWSMAWLWSQGGTNASSFKNTALFLLNKMYGGPALGSAAYGATTGTSLYQRTGTIAVTNGSKTITGTNTHFTQQFSNGDQIVIAQGSGGYNWSSFVYRALHQNALTFRYDTVTVVGDTTMTLTSNYPGTTEGGIGIFYNPTDPQWQGADGGISNFNEGLTQCSNTVPPPCNFDAPANFGKELGANSGVNNISGALNLLLPAAPAVVSGAGRKSGATRVSGGTR